MTITDLLAALHRALDDARVSPHTPVRLQYEYDAIDEGSATAKTLVKDCPRDHICDEDPLVAVAIKDRAVVLSTSAIEPALAR